MREIAEAAIKADMEHRGFEESGGGEFHKQLRVGALGHVVVDVYARAGELKVESPDDYGASHARELYSGLQAEVFDYWPQAIEDLFRRWQDLPSGSEYAVEVYRTSHAENELSTGVSVNDDGSGYTPGNPRLGSDLRNLEARVKQLSGSYAATFSDTYVTPLTDVLERQRSLVALLAIATRAEQEIWSRASADVRDIIGKALEAMRASGPASGGGSDWKVILTVAGAVAAGVAAFATPGSTLAIGFALSSAGAGAAGDLLKSSTAETAPEVPLGAAHPRDVLEKIDDALNDDEDSLSAHIRTQEREIQQALGAAAAAVAGANRGMFGLPRPELATAPPTQVLGPEQSVIVDPTIIGRITSLWIPGIVGDIRRARRELTVTAEPWQRPAGIGVGPAGPWPEFEALQDAAVRLLGNTTTELEESGAALLDAARVIGLADHEVNQELREEAREITEVNRNYVA